MALFKRPTGLNVMLIRGLLGGARSLLILTAQAPARATRVTGEALRGPVARRCAVVGALAVAGFLLRIVPGPWPESRLLLSSMAPFAIACVIMNGTLNLQRKE